MKTLNWIRALSFSCSIFHIFVRIGPKLPTYWQTRKCEWNASHHILYTTHQLFFQCFSTSWLVHSIFYLIAWTHYKEVEEIISSRQAHFCLVEIVSLAYGLLVKWLDWCSQKKIVKRSKINSSFWKWPSKMRAHWKELNERKFTKKSIK